MSDLTNNCGNGCGCNNGRGSSLFGSNNNSCIWIILLLLFCGNNGCGCNNGFGSSLFNANNNGCDSIIWIILLLFFCGGNNGCC